MAAADLSIGSRIDWINHFINLSNFIDKNVRDACGLNITQARILFYISTHEVQPIGHAGTSLFLKPSTITAAAKHLVDDGFISRSYGDLDRRNVYLDITEKGVEIAPTFIPAVHKAFDEDCPKPLDENRDELRRLLLPASSLAYYNKGDESVDGIAADIAKKLNLDASDDEIITHISSVLIIENVCYCLSKMSELDRSLDLSPNEARILRALGNGKTGMRLKDLCVFLNIRPNVASLSIRTLTDRNLINRAVNSQDKRAAKITLARKGTNLLKITRDEYCELFDSSFPGLSDREFSEFFPLLEL